MTEDEIFCHSLLLNLQAKSCGVTIQIKLRTSLVEIWLWYCLSSLRVLK